MIKLNNKTSGKTLRNNLNSIGNLDNYILQKLNSTYLYCGKAHPNITKVIPKDPANARITNLKQRKH